MVNRSPIGHFRVINMGTLKLIPTIPTRNWDGKREDAVITLRRESSAIMVRCCETTISLTMGGPILTVTRSPISIYTNKIRQVGTRSVVTHSLGDGDMSSIVIPMHGTSGSAVALSQILNVIPENAWTWSILELWGTGIAPQGMTMQSFEDFIASSDIGYPLSWRELVDLASVLEQVHDCLIVATGSPCAPSRQIVEQKSDPDLLVVIEGLDSAQWDVNVNEQLDDVEEVKERLASLR
jgi:hypothetical protein